MRGFVSHKAILAHATNWREVVIHLLYEIFKSVVAAIEIVVFVVIFWKVGNHEIKKLEQKNKRERFKPMHINRNGREDWESE